MRGEERDEMRMQREDERRGEYREKREAQAEKQRRGVERNKDTTRDKIKQFTNTN